MIYKICDFIEDLLEKADVKDAPAQRPAQIPQKIVFPKENVEFTPTPPSRPDLFVPTVWQKSPIPHSKLLVKYQKKKNKTKYKVKIDISQSLKFKNCKPKVIAKELTNLDISMYISVHPNELIEYDGSPESVNACPNIQNLKLKNDLLSNLVYDEIMNDFKLIKFFIKLCEKLEDLQNFNSLTAIVVGMQRHKLDDNYFEIVTKLHRKTTDYFELRNHIEKSQKRCVIPLDIMLKDVEESNMNRESEIAAKRFCSMIEYLVKAQEQERYKVKRKYEHFLRWKLSNSEIKTHIEVKEEEVELKIGSIFLFL